MKLFHPKVNLVILKYLSILVCALAASLADAQTVSTNSEGDRIIKYDDGTWRYYEGKDSALLRNVPLEEIIIDTRQSAPPNDPPADTIIYDYRLFTKYVAAAVKYESQMLDKVDANSEKVFALEEKINRLKSENKTEEVKILEAELEILTRRKQDDQRLLSYARSLIKKILKVGKKEDYEKLEKIYVPGLIPEKEISTEDSLRMDEKLQVKESSKVIAAKGENLKPDPVSPSQDEEEKVPSAAPSESPDNHPGQESDRTPDETLKEDMASAPKKKGKKKKDRQKKKQDEHQGSNKNRATSKISGDRQATQEAVPVTNQDSTTMPDSGNLKPEEAINDDFQNRKVSEEVLEEALAETKHSTPKQGTSIDSSGNSLSPEKNETNLGEVVDDADENKEGEITDRTSQVKDPDKMQSSKIVYTGSPKNRWYSPRVSSLPGYTCDFEFQGVDEFTNRQKKELAQELFFTHTDERLKPYLKNRDYVTCNGYITSIGGGFRYLTLVISIASRNAVREYGNIKNGSLLNLKLLNEETVSLFSQSESQGLQDPKTGDTVYKIRYPIDYQKEKSLIRTGVDKVRIVWSSGYEDYEVYNVDFFINQLNCLNSKK